MGSDRRAGRVFGPHLETKAEMTNMLRVPVLAFCAMAALLSSSCESTTDPGNSDSAQLLWTHADKAGARYRPFADADLAVMATAFDRRVVALDATSGSLRWQRMLSSGPAGLNLPFANVLADSQLVFVPAWDLYALDRETGQVRWKFGPPEEYPAASSIAMEDGRIYSPGATRVFAVDARTGAELWRADLEERPFGLVADGGVVYFGTRGFIDDTDVLGAGHVVALDGSTGRVLWKVPVPDPPTSPGSSGVKQPGALTPELFIVGAMNGRVYGIERGTGRVRWEHQAFATYDPSAPYESGVAILDGVAVVANLAGTVEGLDADTGELLWQLSFGGSVTEQLTSDAKCIYLTIGAINCIDAAGGIRWTQGGTFGGGPSYSTPAQPVGNRLFAGSFSGFHALELPR